MPDTQDMDLVREFARHNSEAAFTELVQRHIALVYSVARRCTGNDDDAKDVTQAVFIILARKAAGLHERTLLPGWLYETTRFTAARLLRTNVRRQKREQEACMQSTLNEVGTADVWEKLSPHLEAAMSKLAARDRALLVLRFYENKSGPETAALLGIREDAAHKRVSRALEKLRKFFTKRGVDSTAATIAETISANSVQAAPVALAKTVTAVAITKGATASISTLTLIKGALKLMAWTKAKTAVVVGIASLLAVTAVTVVKLDYFPVVEQAYFKPDFDNLKQVPAGIVAVQPTHSADSIGDGDPMRNMTEHGSLVRAVGRNVTLRDLIAEAYDCDPGRVVLPIDAPKVCFDFLVTVPTNIREHLQSAIGSKLGYSVHHETRDMAVLKLEVANTNLPGLLASPDGEDEVVQYTGGRIYIKHQTLGLLQTKLEDGFAQPVLDETGLTGRYNFSLAWDKANQEQMQAGAFDLNGEGKILNGLGLRLEPDTAALDMVVVEKAK